MRRTITFLALALVALGTVACDQHRGDLYTVATNLQILPDHSVGLCMPYRYLTGIPSRCDAVPVSNVDWSQLKRAQTLRDGTIWTPLLTLTGVWTGSSLALTEPPSPADETTPVDRPMSGTATSPTMPDRDVANQHRLIQDDAVLKSQGIWAMESGWSNAGFYIILVAANDSARGHVKNTYAADIVSSWFQRT